LYDLLTFKENAVELKKFLFSSVYPSKGKKQAVILHDMVLTTPGSVKLGRGQVRQHILLRGGLHNINKPDVNLHHLLSSLYKQKVGISANPHIPIVPKEEAPET
jgi:hypothetical protein